MKPFTRVVPERKAPTMSSLRYHHVSKQLMKDQHGRVDFAYSDVPNPTLPGVVQRMFFSGKTLNVGSNAAKRLDRRRHILARLEARKNRSVK